MAEGTAYSRSVANQRIFRLLPCVRQNWPGWKPGGGVGARPARAVLRELENGTWKEPVVFGSNMRAGREYRSFLADTLLNRALEEIRNGTEPDKEER